MIHHTPPCHPPTDVVTTTPQIAEFFGIFLFERREYVMNRVFLFSEKMMV